jgi:hypothetical protein
MVRAADAVLFENLVGLRILLRKWIAEDAVMFQEALDIHNASCAGGPGVLTATERSQNRLT